MDSHFSNIVTSIQDAIANHSFTIILIVVALFVELIARIAKTKTKNHIFARYDSSIDPKNSEYYLEYYRKIQVVDLIRVLWLVSVLIIIFIINTNVDLSFFAVAAGAIIITFKDFIFSVIAFFFVTPHYPIGLTVRVGGVQWQIIFIRMLNVGLLGKDENGENTGELFTIPSHKFITEIVEKEDLRSGSIMRDGMSIAYNKENFTLNFQEFMAVLRPFLDSVFPMKNAKNVGNYQSYIGRRYKIDFDCEDEKYTLIKIRFVGHNDDNVHNKEKILIFVDQFLKR